MIVKQGKKYVVKSEDGKNLGTYRTRLGAKRRLAQVEMFKHMKGKKSK